MIRDKSRFSCLLICVLLSGCAADNGTAPTPAASAASAQAPRAAAKARPNQSQAVDLYVAAIRDDLSRGKVGIITDAMQLNADEAKIFWPIYQEYEAELFDLGDARVEGIRQFVSAELSGTLDNARASGLATAYFGYEGSRLELLKKYHGIIAEKLSPVRAAQFTQIEHRVGTVVDLLIASELPLIHSAAAAR